ncbi:MAG: SUMF1/EgtB/PvdO family nonheme iron enzyme [Candidatus Velthaea sp.]
METLSPLALDRAALSAWYQANRARSAALFRIIDPDVYFQAPIPLRHPFVFYDGHFPAFSFITLIRNALGEPSIDRRLEDLFNRGIDPDSLESARSHQRSDWPTRAEVQAFAGACDARVLAAYAGARLDDPADPQLERAQAAFTILEHEEMHHETLLYIVHRLPDDRKRLAPAEYRDMPPAQRDPIAIPAGSATLGVRADAVRFAWDNELPEHTVAVASFGCDAFDVTNGEYLAFVRAGGPVPPFWVERDGEWGLRAFAGTIALPHSWPVYCTNAQAAAFARWSGARLLTEAEFHRAAYGTPAGDERHQPWGGDGADPSRGNFDFKRFDPEPVGSYPRGVSAWGIHDLVGNGWEWTSTPFAPFAGFQPMATYPPYSADFFDGEHYVMKGASPVTSRNLVRRSFRNWYRREYPYMYATFRRAWD